MVKNNSKLAEFKNFRQKFLNSMEISGSYSPHTLSAYQRDLEIYHNFLKKPQSREDFYEYITQRDLSTRSKARIISTVRSYLHFLDRRQYSSSAGIDLKTLKAISVKPRLPKLISLKEFKKLYKSAKTKDEHKTARNQITLLLLFGLGCRVSELIQANLQDLNEMEQYLVVTGKRNKQRLLPLTDELFQTLMGYIQSHRPYLSALQNNYSLIINNRGKRPSRIDVWRWLSNWSKKAGFTQTKGPHQFRHGCATGLLENGADLRSIQFLLGHSSILTTQIYTSVQKKHLQKTIQKHHPLSAITSKSIVSASALNIDDKK